MVGSESQWSDRNDPPGLEKGNWVSHFHNGYDPTYANNPHLQHSIELKPEDIPLPSIEDAPSREPRQIVFVLPKLHTIRLYVRILSILVTVIAVILILLAIGLYNHAKGHVLTFLSLGLTNRFLARQITL
jgi:hypothetical protein